MLRGAVSSIDLKTLVSKNYLIDTLEGSKSRRLLRVFMLIFCKQIQDWGQKQYLAFYNVTCPRQPAFLSDTS